MPGLPGLPGNNVKENAMGVAGMEAGLDPQSGSTTSTAFFNAVDNQPGLMASMGSTAFRGSRTITKGAAGVDLTGSTVHDLIKQNFHRKTWGRYGDLGVFNPGSAETATGWRGQARTPYSPFNTADEINKKFTKHISKQTSKGSVDSGFSGVMKRAGFVDEAEGATQRLVDHGMLSRISAIGRIRGAGPKGISEEMASSLNAFTQKAGTATGNLFSGGMDSKSAASHYLAHGFQSKGGQAVAGYIYGNMTRNVVGPEGSSAVFNRFSRSAVNHAAELRAADNSVIKMASRRMAESVPKEGAKLAGNMAGRAVGEEALSTAVRGAGEEAMQAGIKTVAKEAVEKVGMVAVKEGITGFGAGLAAKFGATMASGPAAPLVGAAMMAWQVWDLTKLTVDLARDLVIKPGINLAQDGFRSYKGQIDKAPFGMGFKDNSVAASSRQRGVMAIQNSRLNARSVLGSEAGAMHSHFG